LLKIVQFGAWRLPFASSRLILIGLKECQWKERYQRYQQNAIMSEERSQICSLSLTSIRDLHNNVEVRGGRLMQPIFLHGLPCQLFNVLKLLEFEVAKRMLIVGFKINVDL